jgi:hypothetical protein
MKVRLYRIIAVPVLLASVAYGLILHSLAITVPQLQKRMRIGRAIVSLVKYSVLWLKSPSPVLSTEIVFSADFNVLPLFSQLSFQGAVLLT